MHTPANACPTYALVCTHEPLTGGAGTASLRAAWPVRLSEGRPPSAGRRLLECRADRAASPLLLCRRETASCQVGRHGLSHSPTQIAYPFPTLVPRLFCGSASGNESQCKGSKVILAPVLFQLERTCKHAGAGMAVYPHQLTPEEKNLKKRYARLQEKASCARFLLEVCVKQSKSQYFPG